MRTEVINEYCTTLVRLVAQPIITESGIATNDDSRRIAYIDAALVEVRQCMNEGIGIGGFIQWSLLDNCEWTGGYGQHFGLVEVDFKTFKRTPRPGARHLGSIARANTH